MKSPLAITITGGFGTGKTHLMKWLSHELGKLGWGVSCCKQRDATDAYLDAYPSLAPPQGMEPRCLRIQVLHPDIEIDLEQMATRTQIIKTILASLDCGIYSTEQLAKKVGYHAGTARGQAVALNRFKGSIGKGKTLTARRTPHGRRYVIAKKKK